MASVAAGVTEANDMGLGSDVGTGARVDARVELLRQAENELPQPQPPVEFGFLKVKPEPCIDVT